MAFIGQREGDREWEGEVSVCSGFDLIVELGSGWLVEEGSVWERVCGGRGRTAQP